MMVTLVGGVIVIVLAVAAEWNVGHGMAME
jgi:hypothetical protein